MSKALDMAAAGERVVVKEEERRRRCGGRFLANASVYPIKDKGRLLGVAFIEAMDAPPDRSANDADTVAPAPPVAKSEAPVLRDAHLETARPYPPEHNDSAAMPALLVVQRDVAADSDLREMLSSDHKVHFAESAEGALELVKSRRFDLLLLEVSLEDRSLGVDLLGRIRSMEGYADVPAIGLTQADLPDLRKRLLRAGFCDTLPMPAAQEESLAVIEAALAGVRHLEDVEIEEETTEITLPPRPQSITDLLEMLASNDGDDVDRLRDVLEQEPVVAAWVLQHVNSAFYSLRGSVGSIERAITLLGFEPICNLVLTKVLSQAFARFDEGQPLAVHQYLQKTSVATAAYARLLAEHLHLPQPEMSFTAGMLHQIGRLGLLSANADRYAAMWITGDDQDGAPEPPTPLKEQHEFGRDHVRMGAEIARRWQLPTNLAAVIQTYNQPRKRAHTPEALLTLTVSAGAAEARRLCEDQDAPANPEFLECLSRSCEVDVGELRQLIADRDGEMKDFVNRIIGA